MATVTEELDAFIRDEGNGNCRDALNIALARLRVANFKIKTLREEIHSKDDQITEILDSIDSGHPV